MTVLAGPDGHLPVPMVVDCDPGHDDVLAILVAARHAELVGLTTVSGNAPLADTTRNALRICELAGLDVPVHAGAAHPLVAEPAHATHIHGEGGLGGAPAASTGGRAVDGDDAGAFIAGAAVANPGLWVVAVGPTTNVATALTEYPALATELAGVSYMAGAAGPGNRTPTAEFNAWADPEALQAVLVSGVTPLRMAGLDLTRQFLLDGAFVAQLRAAATPVSTFCADMLDFHLDRQLAATGRRAAPAHDVCAVLAVTHPQLVRRRTRFVYVQLVGHLTRGMTVIDANPHPRRPTAEVEVGYAIDADAARAVLLDAVITAGT